MGQPLLVAAFRHIASECRVTQTRPSFTASHNGGVDYIDVTVPVRPGMPVYAGDPPVALQRVSSLASGGICNLSRLDFGLHSGTHIDAPLHFIDGAPGVEATPIEALIGDAYVVDATNVRGQIDAAALRGLEIPTE